MNLKDYTIDFNYSFKSGLGPFEESRFVKDHLLKIQLSHEDGGDIEIIGQVKFLVAYLDQAWDSDHHLYAILDAHSEYLARHIFDVLDAETAEFNEAIQEHFNHNIFGANFCLIQEVQIKPRFRGYNLGIKALKDIVFHYSEACDLFMIEPYPLQFETEEKRKENSHLELEKLEQDQEKATARLKSYYKSLGFQSVKGFESLLFYSPVFKNTKMDLINLDNDPFEDSLSDDFILN